VTNASSTITDFTSGEEKFFNSRAQMVWFSCFHGWSGHDASPLKWYHHLSE